MTDDPTVFIVDDDEATRTAVAALVGSMGFRCQAFPTGEAFLAAVGPQRSGCLITDLRMPGLSGAALQQRLLDLGYVLPLIVVSGFATTADAVQAMLRGAVTVLDKPLVADELAAAIQRALQLDAANRQAQQRRQELQARLDSLTEGERRVMECLLEGKANKSIARELEVSLRTVESRRRQVFQKTQTDSVAALVQLVLEARQPKP
jgi:FixJ family two-component response regulator